MPDQPTTPESEIPWPKDPPPGWPPEWPWPPKLPVGAASMKKCVEACIAALGVKYAPLCALMCAVGDPGKNGAGVTYTPTGGSGPPPPPTRGDLRRAITAIDEEIIREQKAAAHHRSNAIDELRRAASNRAQGNNQTADEQTRSADREEAKAREIDAEIKGKEKARHAVEGLL